MEVKETPMLYSPEMVKSILAEIKTMTRRLTGLASVNVHPGKWRLHAIGYGAVTLANGKTKSGYHAQFVRTDGTKDWEICFCPYGKPGDILWVRESFLYQELVEQDSYYYKASAEHPHIWKWKPSIHMPKAAARIWLQIESITVEPLQRSR